MKVAILILAAVSRVNKVVTTFEFNKQVTLKDALLQAIYMK